jgi:nitrogen regulatory protein PII
VTEVQAFETHLRLEVYCRLPELSAILEIIREAARTGHAGDGKIFVGAVTAACRIRTGEWGDAAVMVATANGAPRARTGAG